MLATPPVPRLTRRQGLTALAILGPVGVLAACSSGGEPAPTDSSGLPATVSAAVAAQERDLVALYDAVIAAYPELAPSIELIRDQHAQHAATLDASSRPPSSPSTTDLPQTQDKVLVALVSAERRAMRQRIDSCVMADEAGLARTLAFIAASEGSHVPALRDLRS